MPATAVAATKVEVTTTGATVATGWYGATSQWLMSPFTNHIEYGVTFPSLAPSLLPEERERLAPMRDHPDAPHRRRDYKQEIADLLETPHGFLQWLSAKNPDEIVGIASNAVDCPIHRFIRESIGGSLCSLLVGGRTIAWHDGQGESRVTTPDWAASFISAVDRHSGLLGKWVTAQVAMGYLRTVVSI